MIQLPWRTDGGLLPSMLLLRYLEQVLAEDQDCLIDGFACGNGSIPDLLHLCGLEEARLDAQIELPTPLRWEGHGGSRLLLKGQADQQSTLLHHGQLPQIGCGWIETDNEGLFLIQLARLEDAQSVMDASAGADWDHILKALGVTEPTALSPINRNSKAEQLNTELQAWNPLPIHRFCPVSIPKPDGSPPWGLGDQKGNRYPVQITEGAYGPEMLCMIELGPLECKTLHTYDSPVSGSYWEVNQSVIDNGLLRAEMSERGCIKRLSIHGRFIDISGLLCQASIQQIPLDGKCTTQVLESGPVRAQISYTIAASQGICRMTYELYGNEDFLRVSVNWSNPDIPLMIDHASSYRRAPLECAGELAPWRVEQAANAFQQNPLLQHACHWARLSEYSSHCGLAVASEWPMQVSARAGHLHIYCKQNVRYALMGSRSALLGNPGRVVQHCSMPGRAASGQSQQAPAFFLSEADDLVPLWIRHAGNNTIEMLLSEQQGQRGKAYLLPVERGLENADRVNVFGHSIRPLQVTKERDGFEIDYQPYEVFLIKWQFC